MASTDLIKLAKLYEVGADTDLQLLFKRLIEKGIGRIAERKSNLTAKFKKGPNRPYQKINFFEERGYQNTLTASLTSTTLTFSGYILGEDISLAAEASQDALKQHVKKYTVLMRESDGLQVKVSATPTYASYTATVAAHGNHTLSNSTAAGNWRIIGHASSDYDDEWSPRMLPRKARFCGTQIVKDMFELPHSRRDHPVEEVASEAGHQLMRITEDLYNKISLSLLLMEPPYSGGAYQTGLDTEYPAITGVLGWAKITNAELEKTRTYVDQNQAAVDVDALNSLAYNLFEDEKADFDRGNWVIACNGVTYQYIADEFVDQREWDFKQTEMGYSVEAFKSKIGKRFPIVMDNYLPPQYLLMLDTSDVEWGYYGKQGIRTVKLAEGIPNVDKTKITFQMYGSIVRRPRQIGVLYGLPSTYS